jgi:transcriptional regulator of acetoin/glycerol metabolism
MRANAGLAQQQIKDDLRQSWHRSRLSGVDRSTLPVPYELELVEPDSRLWHAARPILEHFGRLLEGTPTCLAFGDAAGRGIETWVGDPNLNPTLDALGARPGFRFAEAIAGTNGVGTPLETGRPIYIEPGQHYVEPLQPLTCAGAPVRHPLTRRLEGAINLTSVAEDKGNLLLPYVMEMAMQVEDRLYEQSSGRERLLLQHFLTTSRGSARPVVVVSPEMMLANPPATRLLESVPQALLWEFAARAVADSKILVDELLGAESQMVAVRCFPINQGGRVIGATLEFDRTRPAPARRSRSRGRSPGLPGLVGRSDAWRRVCRQVAALGDLQPSPGVVIVGEPGTGKRSVALAMLAAAAGERSTPVIFDAALEVTQRPGWLERLRAELTDQGGTPVVITHLDCLTDEGVRAVGAVLDESGERRPAVVATLTVGERPATHCAPLLDRIGDIRIDVPPLRRRPEDILDLVPAILGRLAPGPPVRGAGSEVVQALTRFGWPGNVRQLEATLRAALARTARPEIRPDDLPPDIRRGAPGRRLTPIEQAELDAIVAALDETNGNKVETAARLGISRSTLYRKLRSFGLQLDQVVF